MNTTNDGISIINRVRFWDHGCVIIETLIETKRTRRLYLLLQFYSDLIDGCDRSTIIRSQIDLEELSGPTSLDEHEHLSQMNVTLILPSKLHH